jgi:hypothetical protein
MDLAGLTVLVVLLRVLGFVLILLAGLKIPIKVVKIDPGWMGLFLLFLSAVIPD